MESSQADENPYASPRGFEVQLDADSLLKQTTKLYRRMGWFGIAYILIVYPLGMIMELSRGLPELVSVVAPTIMYGVMFAFFRSMIKTAEHLAADFDRHYRWARWLGILAATLFFPILTVPAILAVRRLGRYRDFMIGQTDKSLQPEEET